MPTVDERLDQLEAQQQQQTRALRLILEGRLDGEMPHAAAQVVALEGGNTSLTVRLGKASPR